jgi:hypothetical protein
MVLAQLLDLVFQKLFVFFIIVDVYVRFRQMLLHLDEIAPNIIVIMQFLPIFKCFVEHTSQLNLFTKTHLNNMAFIKIDHHFFKFLFNLTNYFGVVELIILQRIVFYMIFTRNAFETVDTRDRGRASKTLGSKIDIMNPLTFLIYIVMNILAAPIAFFTISTIIFSLLAINFAKGIEFLEAIVTSNLNHFLDSSNKV